MQTYFVDTWFFIARTDPFDSHHAAALRLSHRLAGAHLLTHDAVLTEMLAFFSGDGSRPRERAAATARGALQRYTVEAADRDLFRRALDFYERRPDKEYSLVDCMSMVVMRDRGIEHVLTNDHHFTQEGFTVLFDAP